MKKPELITQGFRGTVLTKEWVRWYTSKSYVGFFGTIYVYQDKEAYGFQTRGNESNWFIRVQGETESINLLGCQIRGVIAHEKTPEKDSDIKVIP